MGKKDKLLAKALENPSGLSFREFITLMMSYSWKFDRQRGSHQIWYSPEGYRLSVQNRKGKAKGYQVKQFLIQLESEQNHE